MGGQEGRVKRLKALSTAINNTPEGLMIKDLIKNFKDWGCTENKIKEYTKYLMDVGDIIGEKVYGQPNHPSTYYWDYYYLFKPKTTRADIANTASGGIAK